MGSALGDQKARMLAGQLYHAGAPELVAAHLRAQDILATFNATTAQETAKRRELLTWLLGDLGEETVIKPSLRCDYGFNIRIGARSFLNYDCVLLDCNTITIGDEVQFGPGVHIYTAGHPLDAATRRKGLEFAKAVTIGNGAWLGGGAIVCPGVTIGENSVIGAGSVVTKDIPADVVAAGNPCRVLRSI